MDPILSLIQSQINGCEPSLQYLCCGCTVELCNQRYFTRRGDASFPFVNQAIPRTSGTLKLLRRVLCYISTPKCSPFGFPTDCRFGRNRPCSCLLFPLHSQLFCYPYGYANPYSYPYRLAIVMATLPLLIPLILLLFPSLPSTTSSPFYAVAVNSALSVYGTGLPGEIRAIETDSVPPSLPEDRWYHICLPT